MAKLLRINTTGLSLDPKRITGAIREFDGVKIYVDEGANGASTYNTLEKNLTWQARRFLNLGKR